MGQTSVLKNETRISNKIFNFAHEALKHRSLEDAVPTRSN